MHCCPKKFSVSIPIDIADENLVDVGFVKNCIGLFEYMIDTIFLVTNLFPHFGDPWLPR